MSSARLVDALQLLSQLLEYDPKKRITAAKAVVHPYFTSSPLSEKARLTSLHPSLIATNREGRVPPRKGGDKKDSASSNHHSEKHRSTAGSESTKKESKAAAHSSRPPDGSYFKETGDQRAPKRLKGSSAAAAPTRVFFLSFLSLVTLPPLPHLT